MNKEPKTWITTKNGTHVPIFDGESKSEAIDRQFDSNKNDFLEYMAKDDSFNQSRIKQLRDYNYSTDDIIQDLNEYYGQNLYDEYIKINEIDTSKEMSDYGISPMEEYSIDVDDIENSIFDDSGMYVLDDSDTSSNYRNKVDEYLKENGIDSPSDVYNHLLDSGYSDKDIYEMMENDYISDYDIMENVSSYSDLGERTMHGESPSVMLGDRINYYLDEKRVQDDLYDDLREIYYENNLDVEYDDLGTNEDFINWKDDYIQEILDNPKEYLSDEQINGYFDYDKFGYDLSLGNYYYDENTGIASRNN